MKKLTKFVVVMFVIMPIAAMSVACNKPIAFNKKTSNDPVFLTENDDTIDIIKAHVHFTDDMIEPLKAIQNSSAAAGKVPGSMGHWGDSNSVTSVFMRSVLYAEAANRIAYNRFDYTSIVRWMYGGRTTSFDNEFKGYPWCDSGWSTNDIINNMEKAVNEGEHSWINLKIGTNNTNSREAYETDMRTIIEYAMKNGVIPTLCTSMVRQNGATEEAWYARVIGYNQVIRNLSAEYKIPYVDMEGVFWELYPDGSWNEKLMYDWGHYSTTGGSAVGLTTEEGLRCHGSMIRNVLTLELGLLMREKVIGVPGMIEHATVPRFSRQPLGGEQGLSTVPTSKLVEAESNVTLQVSAYTNKVVPNTGTLTYQWYQNRIMSNTGGTLIAGATEARYTFTMTSKGPLYYYCIITNKIADNGDGGTKTAQRASIAVKIAFR